MTLLAPSSLRLETVVALASGAVVGAEADSLEQACAYAQARSDVTVWVPLPRPDIGHVCEALRRAALTPDRLVVEVADLDAVPHLKALGLLVAVRSTSLAAVRGLPVDILRFRGSRATPGFLRRAREQGLLLHADHVDDAVEARRLLAAGCDFAQGTHFTER